MRDLKADLKLCEAATEGPWEYKHDGYGDYCVSALLPDDDGSYCWNDIPFTEGDAKFISVAREGWPEAIGRAIKAEKECTELRTVFEEMTNTIDSAIRYCISGDCDGTLDPRIWCELISKARQILGE